jgi:hypothetical protein
VASSAKPGRCSSSGVVPSALAIRAPRPKNIRAELCVECNFSLYGVYTRGGRTLSTTFGLFLDAHCACYQLRRANNISIFLHLFGAGQKWRLRDGGVCFKEGTLAYLRYLSSLVFPGLFRDLCKRYYGLR